MNFTPVKVVVFEEKTLIILDITFETLSKTLVMKGNRSKNQLTIGISLLLVASNLLPISIIGLIQKDWMWALLSSDCLENFCIWGSCISVAVTGIALATEKVWGSFDEKTLIVVTPFIPATSEDTSSATVGFLKFNIDE